MKSLVFTLTLLLSLAAYSQNIILSEDFQDGTLPDGWSQQTNATDGGWLLGTANQLESQWWSIANHGNIIATNDDVCDCDKSVDYLIMPPFDFSESVAVGLIFDNYYDQDNLDGAFENAYVEYSLDEGITWQILQEIEGNQEGQWDSQNIDLSSLAGNDNVLVAFRYDDDGGWLFGWALDNVMVIEPEGLDLALSELFTETDVPAGSSQLISGAVTNVGAETITAFELTWAANGEDFTEMFSGFELLPFETYSFEMEEEFLIPSTGTFDLSVTINSVNEDETDDNIENNTLNSTFSAIFGSIVSGDYTREYIYYHPENAPENCPLIFAFHGYTGSAEGIRNYSEFNDLADENGFAVCYPQGITDGSGNTFFNVFYDFQNNENVDDVQFTRDLNDFLQANNSLDPERVFATGLSNGGDFSYLLACEASDVFQAVAPVAGFFKQSIMDDCADYNGVSLLEIHGTNDNVTPYNGDPNNNDGWGAYPSIPDAISFIVEATDLELIEEFDIENTVPNDGSTVSVEKYGQEGSCTRVWLYTVNGGGHDWPGAWGNMDINSSQEIWSFFESSCSDIVSVENLTNQKEKRELIKITDLLGREIKPQSGKLAIYIYSDGSVEKKVISLD